jgi:hypothetical protein
MIKLSEEAKRILGVIKQHGPIRPNEIISILDFSKKNYLQTFKKIIRRTIN